jgi:hypothetical protein
MSFEETLRSEPSEIAVKRTPIRGGSKLAEYLIRLGILPDLRKYC